MHNPAFAASQIPVTYFISYSYKIPSNKKLMIRQNFNLLMTLITRFYPKVSGLMLQNGNRWGHRQVHMIRKDT